MECGDRRILATHVLDELDAHIADLDARPEVAALLALCRTEGHVRGEYRGGRYCERCGDKFAR